MSLTVAILKNALPGMASALPGLIDAATAKTAYDIEADWKDNIQAEGLIDTSTYLNSVQARQEGPSEWIVASAATSEDDYPYPIALEYGTYKSDTGQELIRAYGVATRAAEENRSKLESAIAQALKGLG